ncbi:MAG: replicative DNA helicase [Acidobacteria bacterium]|nr:replicative DNA helicase [Acidobacteriota bacterium]
METLTANAVLEKGLPANVEAEKFVLGSVLLDESLFPQVDAALSPEDFILEKHKRIFLRMKDLAERPERIEYLTLVEELDRHGQLESIDGIAYIASLNEGLPRLTSIDSYVKIVKDKSLLRQLIRTSQTIISQCVESSEEVEDILAEAESSVMKVGDAQLRSGLSSPREVVESVPGGIQAFLDPSRRVKGLASPFLKLEEMTTGMHGGELIILAARPAMGKTSFALNMAQHIANDNGPDDPARTVALFSLEMSKESLLTRILCAEARVDQHRFRGGYLNEDEKRRLRASLHGIVSSNLFIDDSADTSIMDISAKCRRLRSEHGLGLVVVDYLQLMASKGKVESRVQEISQISRGLKLLAKDLDVPVLALSQLSRAPEQRQGDHRPILADLRESGSIEQDADRVMFIFREEIYKPDREDLQGIAELIIAKQRNGPTGKIRLAFINKFAKFENLADDIGGAPSDDDAPFDA